MILKASGTLAAGANIQSLRMLLCGEALHKLDILSVAVVSTTADYLKSIILGLGTYFFSVNALSKQKRAMRRRMSKPCGLKVRRYTDRVINPNEYLAVFPG